MVKVEILIENLMDFLDTCESGKLYPKLDKEDTITKVNINYGTAEFIIGKVHSPYHIKAKS